MMGSSAGSKKPQYISGWRLALFILKLALSLFRYGFRRKKYPLFFWRSLFLYRKQKILEISKAVRQEGYYHMGILRAPRWPSAAFDRMVGNGGLNIPVAGSDRYRVRQQINYAILGVSRRCRYQCRHCYEFENLSERESVPAERWQQVVRELQARGTGIIVLSGGEPMLRFDDLLGILETGDKNRSDFHLHTAGHEVTLSKARALKAAGLTAAAVALDDFEPERCDRFKGYTGAFREAVTALESFRKAGLMTYTNVCLRRELTEDGGLWKYLELVKDLQVGAVSLLEPKPCGRYLSGHGVEPFTETERQGVTAFFRQVNRGKKYRNYPYIEYFGYYERPEHLGCLMGGQSHLYINSCGYVQPCVFLPVSFGSIMAEPFSDIFEHMRAAVPGPLHCPCPAVQLAETIKAVRDLAAGTPINFEKIEPAWRRLLAQCGL